jgi:hypothetical protein
MYACNSISTTFWLKEYFHMGERPDINKKEGNLADRRGLKNFCSILSREPDLFTNLHELLLTETFNLWNAATVLNPLLNIMDVRGVEIVCRNKFKRDFCGSELTTFGEFRRIYKFDFPKPSSVTKQGLL